MTYRSSLRATALLALSVCLGPLTSQIADAQQVYKCKAANGINVFQQYPCEAGQGGSMQVKPNVLDHSGQRNQAAARREAQRGKALDSGGLIVSGMSVTELRQRLGDPVVVNTDRGEFGVRQQFVYRYADGMTRYVYDIYVSDGRVTTVQERPSLPGRSNAPCYSGLEIRNATVSARALDLGPEGRDQAMREIERMWDCRR